MLVHGPAIMGIHQASDVNMNAHRSPQEGAISQRTVQQQIPMFNVCPNAATSAVVPLTGKPRHCLAVAGRIRTPPLVGQSVSKILAC
jgi:hypothetical protein